MEDPWEGVGLQACTKTAQTSACIHIQRTVAWRRSGHSSVTCRQRPIAHPDGPSISDFEKAEPSHMQVQWSRRKAIGRTPNVILARSHAHQEEGRRSIKNSIISDSIVRGRALSWPSVCSNTDTSGNIVRIFIRSDALPWWIALPITNQWLPSYALDPTLSCLVQSQPDAPKIRITRSWLLMFW